MKISQFLKRLINNSDDTIQIDDKNSITNIKPKIDNTFEFVYVKNNGTVRELTRDERGYLKQIFSPTDGARPYIKYKFNSKTPDGEISGFIERKKLPKEIDIEEPNLYKFEWRRKWLLIIRDLTDLEFQKRVWLNKDNTNPYNSFIEFMCLYFDDLNLSNGYEKHIDTNLVSEKEYETIFEWHKLLSEYDSPNNDDYNHFDILNDPIWLKNINVGVKSIKSLKKHLSKQERSLLL